MSVKIKAEHICSLCLNVVDTECEVINEVTREMISFLLLKVDLDGNDPSVICRSCTETIQQSFRFKSACIETERSVDEVSNMCRLCGSVSQRCNFVTLDVLLKEIVYIVDLFSEYIPEVDLNVVKNPLICKLCEDNLKGYFSLTQKCCGVEGKVTTYSLDIATDIKKEVTLGDNNEDITKIEEELHIKHEEVLNEFPTPSQSYCRDKTDRPNDITLSNISIKTEEACGVKIEQIFLSETFEDPLTMKEGISEAELLRCPICDYETKSKFHLKQHVPIHDNASKIYKCKDCAYVTKYKHALKQHVLVHSDTSKVQLYQCANCTYETKHKNDLRKHMVIHKDASEVKMHKCTACSYTAKRKRNLNQHMLVHKDPSEVEMYKCTKCTYETKYKPNLKHHVLIHKDSSEVELHKCTKCSYVTKRNRNLKRHMIVHKDNVEVKMYKCTRCAYETKYKNVIQTHMVTHKDDSEVETYKCAMCAYKSKFKANLRQHMLIHKDYSEVQLYKCAVCPHATIHKRHLKKHMLTHKSRS